MKIGVMFGSPETTTGGNALKFYSSVRLEIRRTESIDSKGDEDVVGNRVRVKVVKNKVAPPFRKVEIDIYFGKGISRAASLLDSAVKHGLIDKRGAWFTQGDIKVGQGHENAVGFIEQNKDFADGLERDLRNLIFPGQVLKNKSGTAANADAAKKTPSSSAASKTAEKNPDTASAQPAEKTAAPKKAPAPGQDGLF